MAETEAMEGPIDTDWDVDKYRSPYEPKHHWELKRQFLENNKGRYDEKTLVMYMQVFANAEFMGCRYPKETMDTVFGNDTEEGMAFGIIEPYRESMKNRLQRTFVSGSDAASGKVNRSKPGQAGLKRKLEINDDEIVANKKVKESNRNDFIIVKLKYEENENPCNTLHRSAGFSKTTISWDYTEDKSGSWDSTKGETRFTHRCNVKLQNSLIHSATGNSKNEARDRATRETLEMLSKKCYTILIKDKYCSDGTTIDSETLEKTEKEAKSESIPTSNLGHKLLQMMGWKGGGLGKGGSGISEPISAQSIFGRQGLGSSGHSNQEFKQRIRNIITEYAHSQNPFDLVFTSGFDNEQRSQMHTMARRLNLKSKSFGKDDDRFLTISRKFNAAELIEELKRNGGSTEKYDLVPPLSE